VVSIFGVVYSGGPETWPAASASPYESVFVRARPPSLSLSLGSLLLLRGIFRHLTSGEIEGILVWAARIGTKKRRGAFEKSVKLYLANELEARVPYHLYLHSSSSHPMLQVADYCCWAVAKKWKDQELRPFSKIRNAVRTEIEVSFQEEPDALKT
jgi:hypothetical protein